MKTSARICAALGGFSALVGAGWAGELSAGAAGRPVVVEVFLSQSCKKSPPAATLLRELARRSDVVALAWHVDYWDDFPAHGVGAWADPFAQPAFGERQKNYNVRIRRSGMVSTPQAIVDGIFYAVGSNRDVLGARITEAQFIDEKARPTPPTLDLSRDDDKTIRVRIDGVGAPYDAYAISFRPKAVTKIEAGDNAGSIFDEINVVTGVEMLAGGSEGARRLSFEAPDNGEDCAVLVQERGQGRIVAARYCASARTK